MGFEEALHNYKSPPYPDPNVSPSNKANADFHDDDTFESDERSYGGWPNAPWGTDYYYLVIHTLLDRGVVPAPERIRQAVYNLYKSRNNPDIMYDVAYMLVFKHAHPNNEDPKMQPPEGWVGMESHERSGPVRDLIQNLPDNIVNNYWLLPPPDDNEYVSWDFIFVPRDEEKVLKQLIALDM